jgi:arylsulfatase A-like enzyme
MKSISLLILSIAFSGVLSTPCNAQNTTWPDRTNLPVQPYQKPTKIAPSLKESVTPEWPKLISAPKGAPNVLLVMTDDVGFGASSAFGGPIPTPTYEKLASRGIKYNRFHTTALCSPSRAALITGRNQHQVATGIIMELSTPYEGYNSEVPKNCGSIGEILTMNGYGTSWFGKNHNVPNAQTSPAGPFDLWPTGLGFEKFYGFLGADCDQFAPPLYDNIEPASPFIGNPDYILDEDLANQAIKWIHQQRAASATKPFFVYYTPGTAHAPHQAPKEWIAKYKGKFDMGWDKLREMTFARQKEMGVIPQDAVLNPTPDDYKKWDDLTPELKKVCAREMECYAAALSFADYQIGRLIKTIEDMGELDNTLIIYIQGDNGSSAEDPSGIGMTSEIGIVANGNVDDPKFMYDHIDELGGPKMENHFSHGWAHAMNTPYQWDKKIASHLGGSRTSMVVSWPDRIKDVGSMRSQFTHIIDVTPTILEAVKIPQPKTINGFKQEPITGTSFVYTWDNPKAPERHTTQYFEVIANRGIYHNGWLANTTPIRLPWVSMGKSSEDPVKDYKWELYDLTKDYSQSKNLAAQNPAKLKELQDVFMAEAKKNKVFPLDDRYVERLLPQNREQPNVGRKSFTYYPGTIRIPAELAPNLKNGSFSITASLDIPKSANSDGIILTQGGYFGGLALTLLDGKPTFLYARSNYPTEKWKIQSSGKLSPGKNTVVADFKYNGPGMGKGATVTISVNGKNVATGDITATVPVAFTDEGFNIGEDTGTPVTLDYKVPFKLEGVIEKVVVDLK